MKKKLFIFSAGPSGRDLLRLVYNINEKYPIWEVLGFVDNNISLKGKRIDGLPVLNPNDIPSSNNYYGICGVMSPTLKQKIVKNEIEAKGYKMPVLIHPDIVKSKDLVVGEGSILFSGIHASFNVKLGKCVLISFNTDLGHDLRVDDFSSIMPSVTIGGNCHIGKMSTLGSGVTVYQGLSIGKNSLVGIGSTVLKNIPDETSVTDFPRKLVTPIFNLN